MVIYLTLELLMVQRCNIWCCYESSSRAFGDCSGYPESVCETLCIDYNEVYWALGSVDAVADCNSQVGGHAYTDDCLDCWWLNRFSTITMIQMIFVMKVPQMVMQITAQILQILIIGIMMEIQKVMYVMKMMIMMAP